MQRRPFGGGCRALAGKYHDRWSGVADIVGQSETEDQFARSVGCPLSLALTMKGARIPSGPSNSDGHLQSR